MKYTIEISDLDTFHAALNNTIIIYNDVIQSIELFGEPGLGLEVKGKFPQIPEEKLKKRLQELINVYKQIEGDLFGT